MDKETYRIAEWMGRYLCSDLSKEEELQFEAWLNQKAEHRRLLEQFKGQSATDDLRYLSGLDADTAWRTQRFRKQVHAVRYLIRGRLGWAAAAVVVVSIAVWLQVALQRDAVRQPSAAAGGIVQQDVAPGKSQAVLVLSDGRQVDLGDGLPHALSEAGGTAIIDEGSRGMTYRADQEAGDPTVTNRLLVPKAGTYKLTLSDGTRVWVNALSELEFPVVFAEHERVVTLKGEAFFEVAKNAGRPFRVRVGETVIDVLGTHFNVNSYTGVKTTLLEGSVAVSNGGHRQILRPGEQAVLADGIRVGRVNVDRVIAWKNGEFLFKSDQINEIMDEVSRWYDVSVVYQGDCPDRLELTGSVSRGANLSEVLDVLSFASDASFSVHDRQVTVKFMKNE